MIEPGRAWIKSDITTVIYAGIVTTSEFRYEACRDIGMSAGVAPEYASGVNRLTFAARDNR